MTKEERLSGNRLIAEFMDTNYHKRMKYHFDWNKIIPVYKKIVAVVAPIKEKEAEIYKGSGVTWTSECGELTWAVYNSCRDFDIEKVFPAIVNWIKWYNNEANNSNLQ